MTVIIRSDVQALELARNITFGENSNGKIARSLNYFVDGSLMMKASDGSGHFRRGEARPGGYGVVSQVKIDGCYGFIGEAFVVKKGYAIMQMEKMGVAEALAAAIHHVELSDGKFDGCLVRVFVDSQPILMDIDQGLPASWYTGGWARDITRPIDEEIVDLSERLRIRGCTVELHWVPRGEVAEHKLADSLSRKAHTPGTIMLAERHRETRDLDDKVARAVERFLITDELMGGQTTRTRTYRQ